MLLTDDAIEAVKPRERPFKVADGGSLYLLVSPSGGKLWRFNFRIDGKRKTLALGKFPGMSVATARERAKNARDMLAEGIDPAEAKRQARLGRVAAEPKRFLIDSDGSLVVRLPRRTVALSPQETRDLRQFLVATGNVGGADGAH